MTLEVLRTFFLEALKINLVWLSAATQFIYFWIIKMCKIYIGGLLAVWYLFCETNINIKSPKFFTIFTTACNKASLESYVSNNPESIEAYSIKGPPKMQLKFKLLWIYCLKPNFTYFGDETLETFCIKSYSFFCYVLIKLVKSHSKCN